MPPVDAIRSLAVRCRIPMISYNLPRGFLLFLLFISSPGISGDSTSKGVEIGISTSKFVGSESCQQCHAGIYAKYSKSSHALASTTNDKHVQYGPLTTEASVLDLAGENQLMRMSYDDIGLIVEELLRHGKHQNSEQKSNKQRVVEVHRPDLYIGARHGHNFLYWDDEKIIQMPIVTFKGEWAADLHRNSKEMPMSFTVEDVFEPTCAYCHFNYADYRIERIGADYRYNKNSIQTGVGCERCHGAGSQHIAEMNKNPGAENRHIVSLSDKKVEERINVCAQCHLASTPGDVLSLFDHGPLQAVETYLEIAADVQESVHANQAAVLPASKCFINAGGPVCADCHDAHSAKGHDPADDGKVCLSCHSSVHANVKDVSWLEKTCLDCHMPKQNWPQTFRLNGGRAISPRLTNHKIAVYPESVRLMIERQQ